MYAVRKFQFGKYSVIGSQIGARRLENSLAIGLRGSLLSNLIPMIFLEEQIQKWGRQDKRNLNTTGNLTSAEITLTNATVLQGSLQFWVCF